MLLHDALPRTTHDLLQALQDIPAVEQFTMIGGTAIALHHGHRESEDIDLVFTPSDASQDRSNMPSELTKGVIDGLRSQGRTTLSMMDPGDVEAAMDEGVDLPAAQQNWSIDGIKLTMFAGDTIDRAKPFHQYDTVMIGRLRVLTSDALFECKSRLLVSRSAARDLFDLWFFVEERSKSIEDIVAFALDERAYYSEEAIKNRLLTRKVAPGDPGFKPLLPEAPQDFAALSQEMARLVDGYEARLAQAVLESSVWKR